MNHLGEHIVLGESSSELGVLRRRGLWLLVVGGLSDMVSIEGLTGERREGSRHRGATEQQNLRHHGLCTHDVGHIREAPNTYAPPTGTSAGSTGYGCKFTLDLAPDAGRVFVVKFGGQPMGGDILVDDGA